SEILTLDLATLEYRPKQPARLPSLEAARGIDDVRERVRTLYYGKDKAGAFLRATLGPTLEYVERIADEIAYSHGDIDKAMKWGFGWELGPYELLAALADNSQLHNAQLPINAQPPTPKTQPPTPNTQPPTPNLQPPTPNLQPPTPNTQPPRV